MNPDRDESPFVKAQEELDSHYDAVFMRYCEDILHGRPSRNHLEEARQEKMKGDGRALYKARSRGNRPPEWITLEKGFPPMNKVVLQYGNTFEIQDKKSLISHEELPPATYIIKWDKQREIYYLEQVVNFVLPDKIYGDTPQHADRILQTFLARPLSTGVLLSGVKGSGKTLLAKKTSVEGLLHKIPTLIVNQDFHGEAFNAFIQSLEHETIILFDEFEKTYEHEAQQKVLTLFDGTFPSKKLFIVTTNKSYNLSNYLLNRPGPDVL